MRFLSSGGLWCTTLKGPLVQSIWATSTTNSWTLCDALPKAAASRKAWITWAKTTWRKSWRTTALKRQGQCSALLFFKETITETYPEQRMNRLHKDWHCDLICHERMNFLCHSLLDSETKLWRGWSTQWDAMLLRSKPCGLGRSADGDIWIHFTGVYRQDLGRGIKSSWCNVWRCSGYQQTMSRHLALGCCILCYRVQLHGHKLQWSSSCTGSCGWDSGTIAGESRKQVTFRSTERSFCWEVANSRPFQVWWFGWWRRCFSVESTLAHGQRHQQCWPHVVLARDSGGFVRQKDNRLEQHSTPLGKSSIHSTFETANSRSAFTWSYWCSGRALIVPSALELAKHLRDEDLLAGSSGRFKGWAFTQIGRWQGGFSPTGTSSNRQGGSHKGLVEELDGAPCASALLQEAFSEGLEREQVPLYVLPGLSWLSWPVLPVSLHISLYLPVYKCKHGITRPYKAYAGWSLVEQFQNEMANGVLCTEYFPR